MKERRVGAHGGDDGIEPLVMILDEAPILLVHKIERIEIDVLDVNGLEGHSGGETHV